MLLRFDDYVLDTDRRELQRGLALVAVEPQVFDLLVYVIRNRHRVVSKDDLLSAIWNGRAISDSTLISRITAARRAVDDDGERQRLIKTVARRGIRFVGIVHEEEASAPRVGDVPPEAARSALTRVDQPSIAVLPFTNMSGDPDQEYLVDGITEDITTALSKFRWFLVIARNSAFTFKGRQISIKQIGEELGARYVVEGSVRRAGSRIRVTAQLIEAKVNRHIWADRYDRDIGDVFAVQDEITQHVVAAIDPAIQVSALGHLKRKPPENMDAWDHHLRGIHHSNMSTRRDLPLALEHLRRAIEIDPHLGPAHAALAIGCVNAASLGPASDHRESIKAAVRSARTAIALDGFDSFAHAAACYALTFARQHGAALEAGRRAVELNSNFHLAHFLLAMAFTYGGAPIEAAPALDRATRLSPRDPLAWAFLSLRAIAHYTARAYDAANDAADNALRERPGHGSTKVVKAAALVRLGQSAEARKLLSQVRAVALSHLPFNLPYGNEVDFEHLLTALEQAQSDPQLVEEARRRFAERQLDHFS